MKKKCLWVFGGLPAALLIAGVLGFAEEDSLKPGSHERELRLADGSSLRYGLFIPRKIADPRSIPLIVALHYGGPVTPYYGLEFMRILVEPAFRTSGAIIAAPDCPAPSWTARASEDAVLQLLAHLKTIHPVDEERIAISGFSMGGIGAWHMIARHSELFRAAVIVAGAVDPGDLARIAEADTPVYVIHSDADRVFPFDGARNACEGLKERGVRVQLRRVRGVDHYDTTGFIPALRSAGAWLKDIWRAPKDRRSLSASGPRERSKRS